MTPASSNYWTSFSMNLVSSALCLRVGIAIRWQSELKKLKRRGGLTLATAKQQNRRNYVVNWEGQLGAKPIYRRFDAKVKFYTTSNLVFSGVLKATLISLCFILTDYLQIT